MRRFYDHAGTRADEAGYAVVLDGRPVRTPARAVLSVPSEALAEAIAEEWTAQDQRVRPETMPLMRLAATAIDRIAMQRDAVVDAVAAYAETDLLCYRADGPPELCERQAAAWQPLLDWLEAAHGARLAVTEGVVPRPQDPEAVARVRAVVAAHDDFALSALQSATGASGSVVVALALCAGRIAPKEAVEASQLDEAYQAELWGQDREAMARREVCADDLRAAARFLALLRDAA